MKFSVAMPSFKPDYLAEAVASVVGQIYGDWELVIVDDCSPDDLYSIVAPFLSDGRVRYYRNERNYGYEDVIDNWNRCLGYCTGDYVICMGDDDRLLPRCLNDLSEIIRRYPDLGVFHVRTQIIDGEGRIIKTLETRPEVESSLGFMLARWKGRDQFIGDFCFDASRLKKAGGFFKQPYAWGSDDITEYIVSKDTESALRDGIANTNEPGFQYRSHGKTISSGPLYHAKMEAMLQLKKWFMADFSSREQCGDPETDVIHELIDVSPRYFKDIFMDYVRRDAVANGFHPGRWLRRTEDMGLTRREVIMQSIKGFITKR